MAEPFEDLKSRSARHLDVQQDHCRERICEAVRVHADSAEVCHGFIPTICGGEPDLSARGLQGPLNQPLIVVTIVYQKSALSAAQASGSLHLPEMCIHSSTPPDMAERECHEFATQAARAITRRSGVRDLDARSETAATSRAISQSTTGSPSFAMCKKWRGIQFAEK